MASLHQHLESIIGLCVFDMFDVFKMISTKIVCSRTLSLRFVMVKEILLDPAITYSSDMPKGRKLVPVNGDMFHCQGTARTPSCRTGSASGRKKAHGCSCQRTEPSTRVRDAANVRRLFRCHRVRANKEAPGFRRSKKLVGSCSASMILMQWKSECIIPVRLQHELPCSANALQLNARLRHGFAA